MSNHVLANGKTIRKAITVDTCHGRVMEHSVWDASGRRIAHATFSNHRLDPESGVVLAHHIQLEWPQAEVSLAMDLGHVEVNPAGMPEKIWEMPHMPGYPVMNLQDVAMHRGGPQRRQTQLPPEVPITRSLRNELWQAHREVESDEPADLDGEERPLRGSKPGKACRERKNPGSSLTGIPAQAVDPKANPGSSDPGFTVVNRPNQACSTRRSSICNRSATSMYVCHSCDRTSA